MSLDSPRNRALAKIHIAKKELCLDDDTYRDFLERHTGQRTATYLEPAEWGVVLEEFKKLGAEFKRPATDGSRIDPFERVKANLVVEQGQKPQEALVNALWDELDRQGAFDTGSFAKIETFMKGMGVAVTHPRFCNTKQFNQVIEALKKWLHRHVAKHGDKPMEENGDG